MENKNGLNTSPKFVQSQQKLNAWLVEGGINYQKIANAIGLSISLT